MIHKTFHITLCVLLTNRCRCKFIAIYTPHTICVQYVMPVRYNNRWRIVVGTQQQKRAQARNTCVYVRRAWENVFDFFLFCFFNQNFAHLNCNNCISIEDEAQRRLLSTLNSALGYILVYQVHWLLRQKKRNLFVRLQLTSVIMPIRDTLFTQSLTHTHTKHILTNSHILIRDIMIITMKDGQIRQKLRCSYCSDKWQIKKNEIKINFQI